MNIIRFLLGALGAITLGIAAILVAVAVGLFTWLGTDEKVTIPEIHVSTSEGHIFAEDIEVLFDQARFVPDLGTANLRIRTEDGTAVFAGITDRLTADRFLSGSADPRDQAFWLTRGEGAVADLIWEIRPGQWTFVVVGEDGVAPSTVVIDGEIAAAPFRLAAGTVAGLGLATGIAGAFLLLAAGGLGRRRSSPPAAPASAFPATASV
ncbi:MAG TPA: hypothetical protein VLB67_05775 [Acidimicrobiia bacterium]|nr:hypothetical protein [Acidimicrobiia bacterium]